MIAFVRGVIAAATASALMFRVAGSMSTSTGRPPRNAIEVAQDTKVKAGMITSSFAPMPPSRSAMSRAAVAEFVSSTVSRCRRAASIAWHCCVNEPPARSAPDSSASRIRACSSGVMLARLKGTGIRPRDDELV
jgi:hypothetical protein